MHFPKREIRYAPVIQLNDQFSKRLRTVVYSSGTKTASLCERGQSRLDKHVTHCRTCGKKWAQCECFDHAA